MLTPIRFTRRVIFAPAFLSALMKKATFFVKNKDNPAVKAVIEKASNEFFGGLDLFLGEKIGLVMRKEEEEQFSQFLTAQFTRNMSGDEILETIKKIEKDLEEKLNIPQSSILYKIDDNDSIQP